MGQPLPGLTPTQLQLFQQGFAAFTHPLTPAEGVGPIFNEVSCASCHSQPAIGGFSTRRVTRFGKAASGGAAFDPLTGLGGTLLQDQSLDVACRELVPVEADHTAMRGTPALFGAGLIESIADADILNGQAAQAVGVRGIPHWVQPLEDPTGPLRVGHFGWKGGVATVQSFSIDAALNEMGLTSPFAMVENAPNGDLVTLSQWDSVSEPEDQPDGAGYLRTDRFTHFQRFLAPPAQTPRSGLDGEAMFAQIGCAACHTPTFTTSPTAGSGLAGIEVHPYSDFLLHDMGALGDGIVDGAATETMMMTRPLWGLVMRTAFLHDGRSTGATFEGMIDDAIANHGGQADAARIAFQALSPVDQASLVTFLESLGRSEFDWDIDNQLTEFDWYFLENYLTGPAPMTPIGPNDPAALCDVDQDGDFDLVEFGQLQRVWTAQ
ncbi:MAG TPA: di-heme oxidoredictase family protein [Planctomycetota bacterium]|nr:di-heme oxidoredictase family protein [Planctomycetota bacterium]HRV80782.1 di-heme oxidoredictase family protein [Planctomycetota bacterium]